MLPNRAALILGAALMLDALVRLAIVVVALLAGGCASYRFPLYNHEGTRSAAECAGSWGYVQSIYGRTQSGCVRPIRDAAALPRAFTGCEASDVCR